jgi:hypothetical protein
VEEEFPNEHQKDHSILIKGIIQQEEIIIDTICVPNFVCPSSLSKQYKTSK